MVYPRSSSSSSVVSTQHCFRASTSFFLLPSSALDACLSIPLVLEVPMSPRRPRVHGHVGWAGSTACFHGRTSFLPRVPWGRGWIGVLSGGAMGIFR